MYIGQNRLQVIVITDIANIAVKTGRQNIVEHGRVWQNITDYRRLL